MIGQRLFGRKPDSRRRQPAPIFGQKSAARRLSDAKQLIPVIRSLTATLSAATANQLAEEVASIRAELTSGRDPSEPDLVTAGVSLACEALRRSLGVTLYDVQLLAVIALSQNTIAQMQTGEGKTFVGIAVAAYLGMAGRGVHVMTPNLYLAERDQQAAARVLESLGMTAGLLPERADAALKTPAYDCDVTYGTGHEFGFDYLRDQLTLRTEQRLPPGVRLMRNLQPETQIQRTTMQRGLMYAVVDEADSVMIDDAGSPLVLSMSLAQSAPDADAHRTALALSNILQPATDYVCETSSGRIELTAAGIRRCHAADVAIPVRQLIRPWSEYVQQALRARLLFRRDVHYVVGDDEVRIVDETTGRIFEDRTWQEGLHQAIEAREGIPITAEKEAVAQITRQRFFRLYRNLCGMTGTAVRCESEFGHVFRRDVIEIPLHVASARTMLPTRFFRSLNAKHHAITESVITVRQSGRPVLVGTRSIADSELLSQRLTTCEVPHQLLNGLQDAREAEIVARAGLPRTVTIATNLAGRGTDIALSPEVRAAGGLHVIVAECQTSGRMDRQLIGRCARQGDPGSAQIFVSAEDTLIRDFGPWLAAAIARDAGNGEESTSDFSAPLMRIQATAERRQFVGRMQLLQRDQQRDDLFRGGPACG